MEQSRTSLVKKNRSSKPMKSTPIWELEVRSLGEKEKVPLREMVMVRRRRKRSSRTQLSPKAKVRVRGTVVTVVGRVVNRVT